MTQRRASSVLMLGATLGAMEGCSLVLDFPEPVPSHLWCIDANPARGRREDSQELVFITHATTDAWMQGCQCYCPADHEVMLLGASGLLDPESDDADWYAGQVTLLRTAATLACLQRVVQLQNEHGTNITFDDPGTVSCEDAAADEVPDRDRDCTLDDGLCPPGAAGGAAGGGGGGGVATGGGEATGSGSGDGEATGDSGADTTAGGESSSTGSGMGVGPQLYGIDAWSEVIACSSGDRCDVEAGFVKAVLAEPGLLAEDEIAVRPGWSVLGHQGFVLEEVGPQSLAAALGLGVGDVVWEVNGLPLRSVDDVAHALAVLGQATVVTAAVDRGTVAMQRSYRVVEGVGG